MTQKGKREKRTAKALPHGDPTPPKDNPEYNALVADLDAACKSLLALIFRTLNSDFGTDFEIGSCVGRFHLIILVAVGSFGMFQFDRDFGSAFISSHS